MKKKLFGLVAAFVLSMGLVACGPTSDPTVPTEPSSPSTPVKATYTVAFEVDGARYKTSKVKEGEKITDNIPNPSKEGYKFEGWFDGDYQLDFETYVVTKDVTFVASFSEVLPDDILSVDDVKEAGKDYYMVLGWWEVADPEDPTKVTSGLTKDSVRLFYGNLITYLKAKGATEENIKNIQFRNYSTKTVAEMGAMINEDADVDLVIGVGANIFTTAGALPYNTTDDSKFQTPMGTAGKSRYVAIMQGASDLALETYNWLDTEVGHRTFLEEVPADVIAGSLGGDVINLTVNVHGDTTATTVLTDKETAIAIPAVTFAETHYFDGWATSADGEVALDVELDATLKYADLKPLVAEGANVLDLYPVIVEIPVVEDDLVIYIQVNGSYLTEPEVYFFADRLISVLPEEKTVDIKPIVGGADDFTAALGADADLIIGGNSPLKTYAAHEDGALVNTGLKHFKSTNRKVMIPATVNPDHLELAKLVYNFVATDAPAFEIHTTFWTKGYAWVTEAEVATIKTGIEAAVNAYFGLEDGSAAETYNLVFTYYEAVNTGVADLGAETLALREGKGTDLIVGCGKNVTSTGGVECEKKVVINDIMAAGRYVGLVNENSLTRHVYDTYFVEAAA